MERELNLDGMFGIAKKIWNALKSEQTAEEAEKILGITESLKEKISQMLGIAEDAAEDAVAIAVIAMNAVERIHDEAFATRAVVKPVSQAMNAIDVTAIVLSEYRSLTVEAA